MSSKKLVLDMAMVQDAFFADASLVAVSANVSITRFCWLMNQKFDLGFSRKFDDDIPIKKKNGAFRYHSVYEYCVPLSETRHILYQLKVNGESLFPEIKPMDFLWVLEGEDMASMVDIYLKYLRSMPEIQLVQLVDPDRIKNINYLIS